MWFTNWHIYVFFKNLPQHLFWWGSERHEPPPPYVATSSYNLCGHPRPPSLLFEMVLLTPEYSVSCAALIMTVYVFVDPAQCRGFFLSIPTSSVLEVRAQSDWYQDRLHVQQESHGVACSSAESHGYCTCRRWCQKYERWTTSRMVWVTSYCSLNLWHTFSFNRNIINDADYDTLKFLGTWLDPNLNLHSHVDYVSNELAKGLYVGQTYCFISSQIIGYLSEQRYWLYK